jgi:hypothetical protein
MRMTLEFPAGPKQWRSVQATVKVSRRNNYYVEHGGSVYVFSTYRNSEKILTRTEGKWTVCGRIVFGTLFIGAPEQLSSYEYSRTEEGQREAALEFENFRQSLLVWKTKGE